jgi:hypothetical protein
VKVWHTLSCHFVFLLAHNSHIASSQRHPAFVCWGSRLRPSTYQGDIITVIMLGSVEALGLGGRPCCRCAGAGPASPSAAGTPPLVPGGYPGTEFVFTLPSKGTITQPCPCSTQEGDEGDHPEDVARSPWVSW